MLIGEDPFIGADQREVAHHGCGREHTVSGISVELAGQVVGRQRDIVSERSRVGTGDLWVTVSTAPQFGDGRGRRPAPLPEFLGYSL